MSSFVRENILNYKHCGAHIIQIFFLQITGSGLSQTFFSLTVEQCVSYSDYPFIRSSDSYLLFLQENNKLQCKIKHTLILVKIPRHQLKVSQFSERYLVMVCEHTRADYIIIVINNILLYNNRAQNCHMLGFWFIEQNTCILLLGSDCHCSASMNRIQLACCSLKAKLFFC